MTKHNTRRAPEMEQFTQIVKVTQGYRLRLKVNVQSFDIGFDQDTREDAEWVRNMLCIALAALVRLSSSATIGVTE